MPKMLNNQVDALAKVASATCPCESPICAHPHDVTRIGAACTIWSYDAFAGALSGDRWRSVAELGLRLVPRVEPALLGV